jgi:hypothetical protein
MAGSLPHDLALTGDGIVPVGRLAGIHVPLLVMDGGASPAWAADAAVAIAAAVADGTRRTVQGQDHNVAPDVLAPVLIDFFS